MVKKSEKKNIIDNTPEKSLGEKESNNIKQKKSNFFSSYRLKHIGKNKIFSLDLFLEFIEDVIYRSYFYYRFLSNKYFFIKLKNIFFQLYSSILIIFISVFYIILLFSFISKGNITIIQIFSNFYEVSNNINTFYFSIVVFIIILLKFMEIIIINIFKYFAHLKLMFIFLFLFFFNETYHSLHIIGFNFNEIFSYIIICIFFLYILKILYLHESKRDKEDYYYYGFLRKIYNKTFKDNIKRLEHYKLYIKNIKEFDIKSNFIEPISDEPISIGNDILGNDKISKNIYDIMNGIDFGKFKSSYSIGLVGEWGGGKSSIINLLDDEYLSGNPNFIVHRFNPWNYEKKDLVNRFFGDLSHILGIKNLSSLFKQYLKLIGGFNKNINHGLEFLSGFVKSKTLDDLKYEINDILKKSGRKLVIVIDDLDRCEPNEVLIMLNLIKNLGDFNNIIYLVSYDKEHIIQVLENKKFSGDYIEKIINIERFIPIPGKEELKIYFEDELKEIFKILKFNEIECIQIIKNILYKYEILFEKENLRFIKKLLNQINIVLQMNKNNGDLLSPDKNIFEVVFLFNYIKLKDYKWYLFILSKVRYLENEKGRELIYEKNNVPSEFDDLGEKYLYDEFCKLNGLLLSNSSDGLIIRINYKGFEKEYIDTGMYKEYNLNILKNFT